MKRIIYAILLTGSAVLTVGCSEDGKKSEPKVGEGFKADPRLKPAEAGAGAAPQGASGQGAVKGD